ncbi:MAG: pitrilysin family protein [Nanoarchaeota archaeon]
MKPKFFRKVLKNRMTVIFEKRELPVVSVAFAVKQGGINELEEEKGISHFIEHMLYKGTPTRNAKKIADEIERNGGELNGFTDEAITAYWCKMPSENLKVALEVLSDMVKNPLFDSKELEKERQVIFEEIKMRRDNPMIYTYDSIQGYLYDKPFAVPLIGTHESMNSINNEKIIKKFKEVYTPKNMILCVVGDANFETLCDFAEKNFKKQKGSIRQIPLKLKNQEKIEKRKGINQANLIFAYHSPLANNDLSYSAQALNVLMAGGMSSRLFSEIREKRNLAYSVKGEAMINGGYSYSIIYVGTKKENVDKVKKLIIEEFEKVFRELKEKELNEVKKQIIGNYKISLEDSRVQMVGLLAYEITGNAEKFYEFEEKIKKVKLEDVKNLAKKAIEKYSFFALIPSH